MKAKDRKCIKCGKQAEVFWPCVDLDIKSHPYCRECVDVEKLKCMTAITNENTSD